jgi:hypothetical protein
MHLHIELHCLTVARFDMVMRDIYGEVARSGDRDHAVHRYLCSCALLCLCTSALMLKLMP